MDSPQPHTAPPGQAGWDIRFTRLARAMQPQIDAFAQGLGRRFQALGQGIDIQVRQTPRGMSTFVALVGQRGLVCIIEVTWVDGMAIGQGPCATLDIRLLDACGEVVADGLAGGLQDASFDKTSVAAALSPEHLHRAATALYVATLGHFDLLHPVAPRA
jgi:hypothetical protein